MAKGTAILFAVGAVSGTVLSFELGLLWPNFMGTFGDVIGLPFALEGFAFFTEAIFLGVSLRARSHPCGLHLARGRHRGAQRRRLGLLRHLVNAWMNLPRGFEVASERSAPSRTSSVCRQRRPRAGQGTARAGWEAVGMPRTVSGLLPWGPPDVELSSLEPESVLVNSVRVNGPQTRTERTFLRGCVRPAHGLRSRARSCRTPGGADGNGALVGGCP